MLQYTSNPCWCSVLIAPQKCRGVARSAKGRVYTHKDYFSLWAGAASCVPFDRYIGVRQHRDVDDLSQPNLTTYR